MRWCVAVACVSVLTTWTLTVAAEGAEVQQQQVESDTPVSEEDKRAWSSLHGGWGKRGWQDMSSAWGKRNWQNLNSAWGKRAWRDMAASPWGKRGWQDMSSAWGKRGWQDMSSAWGKRAPERWSNFHGSWGKRSGPEEYEDYDTIVEALLPAIQQARLELPPNDKRAWSGLHGAWGKRAAPRQQSDNNEEHTPEEA